MPPLCKPSVQAPANHVDHVAQKHTFLYESLSDRIDKGVGRRDSKLYTHDWLSIQGECHAMKIGQQN